jgi:hypothetical protein
MSFTSQENPSADMLSAAAVTLQQLIGCWKFCM